MKAFKKIVAVLLALMCIVTLPLTVSALSINDGLDSLKAQFVFGEGPVVGDYSVDYRYFSPVRAGDTTKYPLVIWLHGMGDGAEDGVQVEKSEIAYCASDEFQACRRCIHPSGAFT